MKTITTLLFAVLLVTAKAETKYRVTALEPLPGWVIGFVTGINNRGQVCGTVLNDCSVACGSSAALWTNGQIQNLGAIGWDWSYANGLNDYGQVVGLSTTVYLGETWDGFLWSSGQFKDLGTLGDYPYFTSANSVNNHGIVVGSSFVYRSNTSRAFIYDGVLHDLGVGDNSGASSINNFNQVVGYVGSRAFLWQNGTARLLPTLGGTHSFGGGVINDLGVVAGTSYLPGDTVYHAFIYKNGKITDLGPGPTEFSQGRGINRSNQVVGFYSTGAVATGRAALWVGNKMQDLNNFIDPEDGWILNNADRINDLGQIVGGGTHNGKGSIFVLTPITQLP
jgi:probable HAF family extracellular repeat protein